MNSNRDIIDRLWFEVVYLDPKGQWMVDFINRPDSPQHPVAIAKAAMEEVLAAGFSTEDLAILGQSIRWGNCSSYIYHLDDPGLEESTLAGLHEAFVAGLSRTRQEQEYFQEIYADSFWSEDDSNPDSWSVWIPDAKHEAKELAAYQRLRTQGISDKTLAILQAWHVYEVIFHMLRLVEEFYEDVEETFGLNRLVPMEAPRPLIGPANPLLVLPGEEFAFSPDGRLIAIGGKTAPIRIIEIQTGNELAICKFTKGNLVQLQFSPASDALVAVQECYINFFDAGTGSLLHQIPRGDIESLQWWRTSVGDVLFLIRLLSDHESNPGYKFELYNSSTLELVAEAPFAGIEGRLLNFKLSPDGTKAGLIWRAAWGGSPFMTVWSWPECELLGRWEGIEWEHFDWFPDGQLIAALDAGEWEFDETTKETKRIRESRGKALREAVTGKVVWATEEKLEKTGNIFRLVVSPDGKWLVVGEKELVIWSIAENKKVREINLDPEWCYRVKLSADGRFLGVASSRQCLFWDFQQLTGTKGD